MKSRDHTLVQSDFTAVIDRLTLFSLAFVTIGRICLLRASKKMSSRMFAKGRFDRN